MIVLHTYAYCGAHKIYCSYYVFVDVIFLFSIRDFYAFMDIVNMATKALKKSLQFYTFRLIKQWQYQNKDNHSTYSRLCKTMMRASKPSKPTEKKNILSSVYTIYLSVCACVQCLSQTNISYLISYESKTKTFLYIFDEWKRKWKGVNFRICVHFLCYIRSMNCDAQPFSMCVCLIFFILITNRTLHPIRFDLIHFINLKASDYEMQR